MAKKSGGGRDIVSIKGFAFIAVMIIGLSLLAGFIMKQVDASLADWAYRIERIGLAISVIITVVLSYRWAKGSKQWVFVLWIIAVIVIIVFYVLTFINI